jgi:hypothetical protein
MAQKEADEAEKQSQQAQNERIAQEKAEADEK